MTWQRMRALEARWLPQPRIPGLRCALTPTPEGGAQCVRRARWGLCGGPPATAVPTAPSRTARRGSPLEFTFHCVTRSMSTLPVKFTRQSVPLVSPVFVVANVNNVRVPSPNLTVELNRLAPRIASTILPCLAIAISLLISPVPAGSTTGTPPRSMASLIAASRAALSSVLPSHLAPWVNGLIVALLLLAAAAVSCPIGSLPVLSSVATPFAAPFALVGMASTLTWAGGRVSAARGARGADARPRLRPHPARAPACASSKRRSVPQSQVRPPAGRVSESAPAGCARTPAPRRR